MTTAWTVLVAAYLALLLYLAGGLRRGPPDDREPATFHDRWPSVDLVVAARDEADTLPATLADLVGQSYPGRLRIVVVDDRSTDRTPDVVRAAAVADPRVHLVQVAECAAGRAPKVHAVAVGVGAGRGEIVATTDADCRVGPGWLRAMVAPFADPTIVWTRGPVTTQPPGQAHGFRERFEAIDWLSLMVVSRSLARQGGPWTSSANAQAYRREAFERAGGFGAAAAAPSGDEDLLAQRLARWPGARAVFVDDPAARVWTRPMPTWAAWWRQRWRWASRFRHAAHYHPAYWGGIVLLGLVSAAAVVALAVAPWRPDLAVALLGPWAAKVAAEVAGLRSGLRALGRGDLVGGALLGWALLHPFAVATAALAAAVRSASWTPSRGGGSEATAVGRRPRTAPR